MNFGVEWRAFKATVSMDFKNLMRHQTLSGWLLFRLAGPFFSLATTVVIYFMLVPSGYSQNMVKYTGTSNYIAYMILGSVVYMFTFNVLFGIGMSLYDEQRTGTMGLLLLAPMNRFTWMIGKTIVGLFDSSLYIIIILFYAFFVFQMPLPSTINLVSAFLSLILTLISLYAIGFILAGVFLIIKQPGALANLISPLLMLICGVNFPIEILPNWLQILAKCIPLTYGINAFRKSLLFNASFGTISSELVMLLFFCIILNAIAYFIFRYLEVLTKKKAAVETY